MSELIIRKAEEKDILPITYIEKQCFTVPWTYESLHHDIMENKLAFYIVAELEGIVCGYVGIWNIVDEGHITNVAVSPMFRRKHIASAMLDVLLDVTGKAGVKRFTLEVRPSNQAALSLNEGKGFRSVGVRKGYYEDNGEDAVIMWKEQQEI